MPTADHPPNRVARWVVVSAFALLLFIACVAAAGFSVDNGWGALQCGNDAGASQAVDAVDQLTGATETCLTVRPGSTGANVLLIWEAPHQEVVQEQKKAVARAIWTHLPYSIETITIAGIGEGEQAPIVVNRASLTAANGPQPSDLDRGNVAVWQQGNVRVGFIGFASLALLIGCLAGSITLLRRWHMTEPEPVAEVVERASVQ